MGSNDTPVFTVYPPPTDFNHYESFLSPKMSHCRIPIGDLIKCFQEEPDCRSLYISDTETASLQDILGFDAYIPLKKSTLKLLKKGKTSSIHRAFHELHWKIDDILESECSQEEWIKANSAQALAIQLDKYSIFNFNVQ